MVDISIGWSTDDMRRSSMVSRALRISGDVRSMTAMRCATSACSSGLSPDRTSVALSLDRCASTTAITCGCSLLMKESSWRGSAR